MVLTCGLIALLLAVTVPPAPAELSDAQIQERAEQGFLQGVQARQQLETARPHFQQAAEDYEILRRRGVHNRFLFRDQGNAYLLAGDLPHAILAYRRGLRLQPDDRQLQACLARARERVVQAEGSSLGHPPSDALPPWLPWIPPGWCLLGGLLGYSLLWVALTRWWMVREGPWLTLATGLVLLVVLCGANVLYDYQVRHDAVQHTLAVIAEDKVFLRQGNGLAYPPRYESPLNRGVEARVLFVRGNWLQIELASGAVGWIPDGAALVDRDT
jgi:hypothetical protein